MDAGKDLEHSSSLDVLRRLLLMVVQVLGSGKKSCWNNTDTGPLQGKCLEEAPSLRREGVLFRGSAPKLS
jgi:hypothetical protein